MDSVYHDLNLSTIFVDMDGVTVDYELFKYQNPGVTIRKLKGAYSSMEPIPNAIEHIRKLISMSYDVWFATRPNRGKEHTHGYMDKVDWVWKHIPEMGDRVILSQDKSLLGDRTSHLIDDNPDKANCLKFKGTFHHFKHPDDWFEIYKFFQKLHLKHKLMSCTGFPMEIEITDENSSYRGRRIVVENVNELPTWLAFRIVEPL